MKTEPNETINPIPMVDEDGNHYIDKRYYGLTKREYFSAMAMQGYLAGDPESAVDNSSLIKNAEWAVKCADALITALNK